MTKQVISFFAMDQGLKSENKSLAARKPRLYTFLVTGGFILLGSVAGLLVGDFLFTYFIPSWSHTEIDTENHNFREITLVEYFYLENHDLSQDNVILKTEDGAFFSYHHHKWQQTELPDVDLTKFPHTYPPCNEWASPPPASYLRRTKDTAGVDFAHALANSSRCYILFEDGNLELWTRDYGVFDLIYIGFWSLFLGMLIGGIFGKRRANKKVYASFLS